MKKLIVAAAVVCTIAIASTASAATYAWSAMADWVTPDGNEALVGAKAYVFDASVYAFNTITEALAGGDKSVLTSALDNYTITEDGNFEMYGDTGMTDDGQDPAYARMYAILVDQDSNGKDWFYTASADPVKITDAVVSDGTTFGFCTIETGAVGGAGWTEVAPEPTSGLLLLIGVAGLALKRKRA